MRLNRRPRVLRTAALATGTSVALLLPAAAAFADDASSTSGDQRAAVQEQVSGDRRAAAPDQAPGDRSTAVSDRVSDWPLADGSTARVRQTGEDSYSADVVGRDGVPIGSVVSTGGRPAYAQNNGLHIVLWPDGTVSSWRERVPAPVPAPKPQPKPAPRPVPKPAPKPAPKALPEARLADGTVATFAEHAKDGPRVRVSLADGRRVATVDPEHLTVRHRGWTYGLAVQPGKHAYRFVVVDTPKQGGNSWVYDLHGSLVAKYHAQKPAKR
ncbi:hypothetical protein [Streptomyces omiyaensis]|uniref:Secreted protein n=1 Tax=Streptomyces omiyaensis TaxID=68247 RepID=A0ABW7BXD8_9ACTN|nr:hypothetical protein [Streptomyces omiyaensis]GGY43168.1 hypothetical protein GCM10010363_24850 [Streptomyces omiyaensis]